MNIVNSLALLKLIATSVNTWGIVAKNEKHNGEMGEA